MSFCNLSYCNPYFVFFIKFANIISSFIFVLLYCIFIIYKTNLHVNLYLLHLFLILFSFFVFIFFIFLSSNDHHHIPRPKTCLEPCINIKISVFFFCHNTKTFFHIFSRIFNISSCFFHLF